MSTEFRWNHNDFEAMYQSCKDDDAVRITIQNIPSKKSRILEAGSGSGRVVKYLYDMGYKKVEGIELNKAIVKQFNKMFPDLKVIQGDILDMPYKDESFNIIASYGVIEHFVPGLSEPLIALKRVLKKNGVLIVSVPSMNLLRTIQYGWDKLQDKLKFWKISHRNKGIYYIHPQFGDYFEYRLTPKQFRAACIKAGFRIVGDHPIYQIDGLYHIFGNKFVKYINYKFCPTSFGSWLNKIISKIPFVHNHMHLLVLRRNN